MRVSCWLVATFLTVAAAGDGPAMEAQGKTSTTTTTTTTEQTCQVAADGQQVCAEQIVTGESTDVPDAMDHHQRMQQDRDLDEEDAELFDGDDEDIDEDEEDGDDDEDFEDEDEDEIVEPDMGKVDRKSIGVEQHLPNDNPELADKTRQLIEEASTYREEAYKKLPISLVDICKNNHQSCSMWAAMGECEANPKYMKKECAPACKTCDYLSVDYRCPLDPNAKEAWGNGDLDKMFERLTAEPYLSKYSVQILARPPLPWVITMDGFLNQTEAEWLVYLGSKQGYERSTDVGTKKADGTYTSQVSSGRTSTNAWCQDDCYKDEIAQTVIHRISNVTGIDEINSEYLQMLRYEPGQFYKSHHDYIPHDRNRQQGVRILTVYLYLNDVKAGGGTNFPYLGDMKGGLTVMPKQGRVLIWPSVRNHDPHSKDHRTMHQALPVEDGVKYGANAWFHMRDFKTPNRNGCQ